MRWFSETVVIASALLGIASTARAVDESVDAIWLKFRVEPLVAAIPVKGETNRVIEAMLRELTQHERFEGDWSFNDTVSRFRLKVGSARIASPRTVITHHGTDQYIIVDPVAAQYVDADADGLIREIIGGHRPDDSFRVESIHLQHTHESRFLAGLRARKSTMNIKLLASDELFDLRLERNIAVTIWHTQQLPAQPGLEITSLLAGPDLRADLKRELVRERIGFPLLIETRVHDWSGDGSRSDPGSMRWQVEQVKLRQRMPATGFARDAGLIKVDRLPLDFALEPVQIPGAAPSLPVEPLAIPQDRSDRRTRQVPRQQ